MDQDTNTIIKEEDSSEENEVTDDVLDEPERFFSISNNSTEYQSHQQNGGSQNMDPWSFSTEISNPEEDNLEECSIIDDVAESAEPFPIVDKPTTIQHYQQNDGSQNSIDSVPVFNGSLDISGSVVFQGPFVVNGDTTMDGSVVIRPANTDTEIIRGNDKTHNLQFDEDYNRLDHKESKPHSFSIRSGPASVLASGTVIAFDDNPIEISFGNEPICLLIMFSEELNPQSIQARIIDDNIIEVKFFKSQDQFGHTGTLKPIPLGVWQDQQLYLHCRFREFSGGDITIDFGIYLVEETL